MTIKIYDNNQREIFSITIARDPDFEDVKKIVESITPKKK